MSISVRPAALGRFKGLIILITWLLGPASAAAWLDSLDFCKPESWVRACQEQHTRRRDLYCSPAWAPLRKKIVEYCIRHAAVQSEIAQKGIAHGKNFKYVISHYGMGGGIGNRFPGMISGLFLAIMTDRIFLQDYDHYDEYFESPLNLSTKAFLPQIDHDEPGFKLYWQFLHVNYTETNIQITEDLIKKYDEYNVLVINGHADYLVAPFSANKHWRAKVKELFPTHEIFWPLAPLVLRYNQRLRGMVAAFQQRYNWTHHTMIGVQIRTLKVGREPEVFHRFADLTRSLVAQAGSQTKPPMVFLSSDNSQPYADMRAMLEDMGVPVIGTENEGAVAQNVTEAGNPGTEDIALTDLALLSHCQAIIISGSSSFGGCAAALGGLHPYYITQFDQRIPGPTSFTPSYWKATSSEPCHYQGWWNDHFLSEEALQLWRAHPLHNQWRQCHAPYGGAETDEQKTVEAQMKQVQKERESLWPF